MTVVMSLTNWLVVLPLYMQVLGMKLSIALPKLVLFAVVPFNLIKGVLVGTVFALIANRLQHWLNHQI
jgi:riboflavin transporter FmnP